MSLKGYPLILAMDSNAHSSLYGLETNKRGEDLEDFIFKHNLEIENTQGEATFITRRGENIFKSCIDITLTKDLVNPLKNWRVDRKFNGSDHFTIRYEVGEHEESVEKFRNFRKADWEEFTKILTLSKFYLPERINRKKIDKMVASLYKNLVKALDAVCPEKTRRNRKPRTGWFKRKHKKLARKVRKAYAGFVNVTSADAVTRYLDLAAKYKKLCKRDRKRAWCKFKESIQTEKEMADLAKFMQRQDRNDINSLEKADGSLTTPGEETLDLLIKTHFPAATDQIRFCYSLEGDTLLDERGER